MKIIIDTDGASTKCEIKRGNITSDLNNFKTSSSSDRITLAIVEGVFYGLIVKIDKLFRENENVQINTIKDRIEVSSRLKDIDKDLLPIANMILDYAHEEKTQNKLVVPVFRVLDALILKGKDYNESN